jgi:hypothetical protein
LVEWATKVFFGLISIETLRDKGECTSGYQLRDNRVVAFPTTADAEEAVKKLGGMDINGSPVTVEISNVSLG